MNTTKEARIYLAGCALQGFLSNPNRMPPPPPGRYRQAFMGSQGASAVEYADAVLQALEETE